MRYTRVVSQIQVVGHIWQPGLGLCAMNYTISISDLRNMLERAEKFSIVDLTREDVEAWLALHSGDFHEILDFRADLSYGDEDKVIEWVSEDNECIYNDCMFPSEE